MLSEKGEMISLATQVSKYVRYERRRKLGFITWHDEHEDKPHYPQGMLRNGEVCPVFDAYGNSHIVTVCGIYVNLQLVDPQNRWEQGQGRKP